MIVHKRQQSQLVDASLRVAQSLWATLFDPKNINGSWSQVEPLLVGLVQQRHQISAALASSFITELRRSLGVGGRYVPSVPPLLVAEDIIPWLQAAGPAKAMEQAKVGGEIISSALDSVDGSLTRMILDGGRSTVEINAERDPKCLGWERSASAGCCAFCAMLTGNTYHSAESAGEGRDWHHKCRCDAVPVYSHDQAPPPNTATYRDLWNESTRGLSGNEARIAFRRAIEGRAIADHP